MTEDICAQCGGDHPSESARADGICFRPGCGKQVPTAPPKTMPKGLRAKFLGELSVEPFCSAACCREYHGTQAQPANPNMARGDRSDRIAPCGTASAYDGGCRCDQCRGYKNERSRAYRERKRQQAAGIPAVV